MKEVKYTDNFINNLKEEYANAMLEYEKAREIYIKTKQINDNLPDDDDDDEDI